MLVKGDTADTCVWAPPPQPYWYGWCHLRICHHHVPHCHPTTLPPTPAGMVLWWHGRFHTSFTLILDQLLVVWRYHTQRLKSKVIHVLWSMQMPKRGWLLPGLMLKKTTPPQKTNKTTKQKTDCWWQWSYIKHLTHWGLSISLPESLMNNYDSVKWVNARIILCFI